MKPWDTLWQNVHLADFTQGYARIEAGALAISNGQIAWLGPQAALPAAARWQQQRDGAGALMTPGLIDCHTHVVYAGSRSQEFEARLNGVSYEALARQGGGILSTVRATRATDLAGLRAASLPRVRAMLAQGVTTLEVKSGYGLDPDSEARMLEVARSLPQHVPVRVSTTFLGAHALPPEYADDAQGYVQMLCTTMLPALAARGLVDAVDAFCERIAFSVEQVEQIFAAARSLQLPVKLHAEQLSDSGGAALVARYHGCSADHLEYLSEQGIAALAAAGTVAVLLPGAFYALRETRVPPIDALRAAGVPMAVATDCNPGTSPLTSLPLAMNMACIQFRLTPLEVWQGVTCHAARALGLRDGRGQLRVGAPADLAVWDVAHPAEVPYQIGGARCLGRVVAGQWHPTQE